MSESEGSGPAAIATAIIPGPVWDADMEVHLFHSMAGHKPVGFNKHFQMICIQQRYISMKLQIWRLSPTPLPLILRTQICIWIFLKTLSRSFLISSVIVVLFLSLIGSVNFCNYPVPTPSPLIKFAHHRNRMQNIIRNFFSSIIFICGILFSAC